MTNFHVVLGCNGPLGVELMSALAARGEEVRGVCRSGRSEAPKGVAVVKGDASDPRSVEQLCRGAAVVYSTIGVEYTRWSEEWPAIVGALVEGVRRSGARLVFADNLYAYGPQDRPLVETMAYTDYGHKPALRARLARTLESSGLPVVIARASDFYGPRVKNSLLGERVFTRALLDKPIQLLGDPATLHSFTYIGDFAQALATLGADEAAVGQSWHVPTAPAESTLAVIDRVSRLLGRPLRTQALKPWMLKALGLVSPTLRELDEISYQYCRPFVLDDSKFRTRYFGEPTPLSRGLTATLSWYALSGMHAHAA